MYWTEGTRQDCTVDATARDVAVVDAESEPGSVKKSKAEYSSSE